MLLKNPLVPVDENGERRADAAFVLRELCSEFCWVTNDPIFGTPDVGENPNKLENVGTLFVGPGPKTYGIRSRYDVCPIGIASLL